ncbi:MAG TPA: hypothetical protein VMS18_07855 [Candidatus Binatia bacterium]|nr:hypothetical protein [Candidatus Binatia bacterium]
MTRGLRIKLLSAAVVLLSGLNAMAQHTLQGTYIDQVLSTATAIPAGTMVAIGNAISITCTPSFRTGCTVVADMWASNGAGTTSGNQFELCLLVDGVRADPYCYGYQGITPADGTWGMATSSQSMSGLTNGTHTVQAYFWSRNGCTVVGRHFNYYVYNQ